MEIFKILDIEKKKTIIMVTHNPNLAKYCDRIIHLKDGEVDYAV